MRPSQHGRRSVRRSVSTLANQRRQMQSAVTRALVENLEERKLLSSGEWYAVFAGMTPGNTFAQQTQLGQNLLHSAGITDSQARVIEAMDFSGAFRIQTPLATTLGQLSSTLGAVAGYILAADYTQPQISELRKVQPAAARSESLYGPFDYDNFLSREKNGEIPDQGGSADTDPFNVLGNNNAGATGTGLFTQSETSIVAWGNNVVLGFNDAGSNSGGTNKFTGFSRSTDGGVTFTDGGTLPTSAVGDAGDPVLARDNITGRIYFSTLGFSGAGTIQMFRSDDGGASWLAPVNASPGGSSEDKQWHTVDNYAGAGQGNVYVLSRRFGASPGIYFFKSTDGGATFGPNGGTLIVSNSQGAFVTVAPDHSIQAYWYAGTTLQMRKSTDFGATFGAPVTVASGLVGGVNGDLALTGRRNGLTTFSGFRSNEFPHAVVNPVNGDYYVVYANNPAGTDKADIFMVQSTTGGATWSAPVRVNDDSTLTDQWQPTLAITPDGSRIGFFYYSRQEDPTDNNLFKYYGRIGAISGSTVSFLPSFAISDTPSLPEFGRDSLINAVYMGDYDTAVATPGAFHVVWSDNRSPLAGGGDRMDPNVFYKKIPLGLAVATTTPAVGSVVSTIPVDYNVVFSDDLDIDSVDASDFTVDGVPADSFTVDGADEVTFSFLSDPFSAEGQHTMAIAAGTILRDGDNDPILEFSGAFRYDTLTLEVVSTNPGFPGGVFTLPGPFSYDVNFNEPIDPASVATSDLGLSGIPGAIVTGFSIIDADTVNFTIGGVTSEGTLTANIAAGAIKDQYGNSGTAFSASYAVDIGTVPYPVPLVAKKPSGSLVYDPTASGIIGFAGDEDTFTLNLDPNQKISVLVTSAAGLQSEIELRDPSNVLLASSTAGAAGQNNLLQTVNTTSGGTYLFRVRGAGGTTGSYTVQVVLNSALETEGKLPGASNDTLGTAQNAGPSFLNLATTISSMSRGAVQGTTDIAGYSGSAVPFAFEDISATGTLITFTNQDDGATSIPLGFSYPHYGAGFSSAFVGTNGVIAFGSGVTTFTNTNLTTSPTQAVIAPFWDDLHLTSGGPGAGVYYQTLGSGPTLRTVVQWHNVRFFGGGTTGDNLTFQAVLFADGTAQFNYLDIASGTAAGNNGGSATVGNKNTGTQGPDRLLLAFNDGPNAFVGSGQSTVINVPNPTPDLYAVSLTAGQKVDISATNPNDGTGAGLDLALLDSGGGTLATGAGGSANLGKAISGFTPATTGTYYVRMSGASSVPYNVVVTRDAGFDKEDNNSFATAQDISATRGALGSIAVGGAYESAILTPAFEDISATGTVISALTGQDDAAASVPIGFNFSFFGANQSSVFVSTNGIMTFGTGFTTFGNTDMTTTPAQAAIAPFWDDLHAAGGAADSNIFFQTSGSGPNEHLTVQWNKVRFFSGGTAGDTLTFQAQLYADGRIEFNYLDLVSGSAAGNNGGGASVGIKAAGTQGPDRVLLSFNSAISPFVGTGKSTRLAQPAPEDWYSFFADVGSPLRLATSTPADGPGEFVNDLNLQVELYDPAGNLIASGSALGDGRNEQIGPVFANVGGNYRVRVLGEADSRGEYVLGYTQSGVMTIADPCIDGQDAIVVGGTSGNDLIQFKKSGILTQAWLNGTLLGTFATGLRVIAYGFGGNDTIQNLTNNSAMFFGGDGNDQLSAGNGGAVLVGGAGNDVEIVSANGRDLLIAGSGADSVRGGNGEDILIGGSTAYDAGSLSDLEDLCEALGVWANEGATYAARTSALLAGAFSSGNIIADSDADTLRGENGRDWFFSTAPDSRPDRASNELIS